MTTVLTSVLPVFLLILLGYVIRWRKLLAEDFWKPAETLTYYVLFPALLMSTLAGADLSDLAVWPMAGAIMTAIVLMTVCLIATRPLFPIPGASFTSIFQGSMRQNTYIGLAVAYGVFGDAGLTAAAVAVAAIIPLVNVLAVGALGHYATNHSEAGRRKLSTTALETARNPLIVACVLGLVLQVTGVGLPPILGETLDILSRGALTLGLLAVGAGLRFKAIRSKRWWIALAVVLKLLVMPVVTAAACILFGVTEMPAFVAVLFNGLPTAPASYILSRQLGGDADLMASIITAQVLAAMVILPIVLTLFVPF